MKTSCEEAIVNDMCGEDICFEYEYLSSAGEKESSSGSSPRSELQDDKHHGWICTPVAVRIMKNAG